MSALLSVIVATLLVITIEAQSRSVRCQSREGREPNLSDDSCTTYLVCSNYTGQIRRCQSGRQYDFKSRSCRADSAVFCNAQRRSQSRSAANTTSAPQADNTTVSVPQTTRANTLLTILNALFPQPANNNPGIVGLQGNAPGIVPGVPQGFIGFPLGALPPADGGFGLLGAQGAAPQNQVPFINLLGNNVNEQPVAAGFNIIPRQIIQTAGIPGLGHWNDFQGTPSDTDLFGGVLEQNVGVLNPRRQKTKVLRRPQYPELQSNGFSFGPLNQVPQILSPSKPTQIQILNQGSQQLSPYNPPTNYLNQLPTNNVLPNTPQSTNSYNQLPQGFPPAIPVRNSLNQEPQNFPPEITMYQTSQQLPVNFPPDVTYSANNNLFQGKTNEHFPSYSPETFSQIPKQNLFPSTTTAPVPLQTNVYSFNNVPQLSGILK